MTAEKLAIDGGTPVTTEPFPSTALGPGDIGEEEIAAVTEVLRSKCLFRFSAGDASRCAALEAKFRAFTGCDYALAVGGGTAALICGLVGIGVGEGDEVIVPGLTYIASASAALICGGVPVIAEIDDSLTLDPADVERKITPRTKAIMPVHMRGIPCKMDEIIEIARRHHLFVIEDCAQACGGLYRGTPLGAIGNVGCFSLQQFKVITAGEGGMVVTRDRTIYERAAVRHDSAMCFWKPQDTTITPFAGENFRMNEMEGALGCVQFDRMAGILQKTRRLKRRLLEGIRDIPGITLHRSPCEEGDLGISAGFFLPTSEKAKKFAQALRAEGVPAASVYDKGIPDRHIYCYWEYVMGKYSADASGWPWTSPKHDPTRVYSPDMCPRTLDLLGRVVVFTLSHRFEDQHIDWMIRAVHKVARALT